MTDSKIPSGEPPNLAGLACFNLYVGWRRARAFYKPHMSTGMTPQRMYLLELVKAAGSAGMRVSDLAEALSVDMGTISGLIARMESEGLVTRRRSESSQRVVEVTLTAAGKRVTKDNERRLEAADKALYAALTQSEIRALQRVNRKLQNLLNQIP